MSCLASRYDPLVPSYTRSEKPVLSPTVRGIAIETLVFPPVTMLEVTIVDDLHIDY